VHSDDGALLYLRGTPIGDAGQTLRALVTALMPGRGAAPVTLRADDGDWKFLAPGVTARLLHRHGDRESCMLRFAPGASLRANALPVDQESLVVQGEVYYGRSVAVQGDYQLATQGHAGPELASDEGAVLFVRGAPLA